MKFGKFYRNNLIIKWKDYYIDYKKLKKIIKDPSKDLFYNSLNFEINKLNNFFKEINKDSNQEEISNFYVMNYMAIIKSVKKYDKKKCKCTKRNFFYRIEKMPFYNYYLKLPRKCDKIKLIIFDKDGTLIKINEIFGNWVKDLVDNLSIVKNKEKLLEYLGYNISNECLDFNSIVAKGTNDDIRNYIIEFLINQNEYNENDIKNCLKKDWISIKINRNNIVKCGDINKVFDFLESNNIKIAICTSDDRNVTEETINILNLRKYISSLKCGDDHVSSKPSPEPIWEICNNLNIDISNTIMIGDTISDIHAGINAKCAKVIGVLTGNYNNIDFKYADYVIKSIDELPKLLRQNNLI